VSKAIRYSTAAALFLALATGTFMIGSMPARAADPYGCRGDQACIKTAETTQCDAFCQQACRDYRYDAAGCYVTWGPKFVFRRQQLEQQRNTAKHGTR